MPTQVPDQSYYPGWKLRLVVRLDEFDNPSRLKAAPVTTTKNLNGVQDIRSPLEAVVDKDAPAGVHRYVLQVKGGSTIVGSPQDQIRSDDGRTFEVVCVPEAMSVKLNGIRTADQLSATIRFIDCPLDPRVIRACAVEAYVGTFSAEEYGGNALGMNGDQLKLIPDTYLNGTTQRTNSRFLGWVDKWSVHWSDTGEPTIQLECTDNTRQLLEVECPPNLMFDMKKPIDEAIALYLAHFPRYQGLTVEFQPAGEDPPILEKVLQGTSYRPNLGPYPSKGGGHAGSMKIWDMLTDMCGQVAMSVRVEGTKIIVQNPRSFMKSPRSSDPFQGRTLSSGEQLVNRRFIYGRNVKTMKISRDFPKGMPKNIEVRCYDAENKKLLVGRFPLPGDRALYALPGNLQTDQHWHVVRVQGIKDEKVLRQIAQSTYEQLGRNELSVEIDTKNMASFGGGNLDPDILDMVAGDTFDLLTSRDDYYADTTSQVEKMLSTLANNERFMKQLGFSSEFAAAYAKAYTDANFLNEYKVKNLTITCNSQQGIDLKIHGVNYIGVRADKFLLGGEEPANPTGKATAQKVKGQ